MTTVAAKKVGTDTGNTTLGATFDSSHVAALGNLLLARLHIRSNASITTPLGWTLMGHHIPAADNRQINLYAKVSDGTETGIAFSSMPTARKTVMVREISGADAAAIVAGTVSINLSFSTNETTAGTSLATASIDPASTGSCLLIASVGGTASDGASEAANNSFTVDLADGVNHAFDATRTITDPGSTSTTLSWLSSIQASTSILCIPPILIVASRGLPRGLTRGVRL